ncbi:MAG: SDR family NAD(P)-dependent oxidoreductase [Chromatiales bacterium]|nr:SDR family NAD(P)-dependent oxidoreductase [Chromatiales bacterium]
MDPKGLAAVVTGGGSGLGRATAEALAAAGARVTAVDLDGRAAGETADTVGGLGIACDVADADAVEAAFARAAEAHGAARIVVSCAGIAPAARIVGRAGAMPLGDFERVIRVNLVGTFNVMRVAAAAMSGLDPAGDSGERGVIVNTASVAAFEGQIGQSAYSASKGGVAAMTLPAARELARFGVRVMTIAPGIMGTPMVTGMPDDVQRSLAEQIPFPHRLGRPEEYARLVLHIVENALLNGEVIRLDGAIRMQPR